MAFRVKTIGLASCLLILALPLTNGCSKSIAATTPSNSSAPSSTSLTTQEPQIDVTAIIIMTPTTTVTSITT